MKSKTSSVTEPNTKGEMYVLSEPTIYRLTEYMHSQFGSELRIDTLAGENSIILGVKSPDRYLTITEITQIQKVTGFEFLGVRSDGALDFFKDLDQSPFSLDDL